MTQSKIVQIQSIGEDLYGIDDTGKLYVFHFGDPVHAWSIKPRKAYHDDGFQRRAHDEYDQKHVGFKNRGWRPVVDFIRDIPEGFEIRENQ